MHVLLRNPMRMMAVAGFALSLGACATTKTARVEKPAGEAALDDTALRARVEEGALLMARDHQPQRAIDQYFDPVIQRYATHLKGVKERVYCASTTQETLAYMVIAASDGVTAVAKSETFALAHFLKAYGLVELHDMDGARVELDKALALSPMNSQYLSELGNWFQARRDFPSALDAFKKALDAAPLSREEFILPRKTRALRGIGFSLIELDRLDEAEVQFREALRIDPEDAKAKGELQYIQKMRAQKPGI